MDRVMKSVCSRHCETPMSVSQHVTFVSCNENIRSAEINMLQQEAYSFSRAPSQGRPT